MPDTANDWDYINTSSKVADIAKNPIVHIITAFQRRLQIINVVLGIMVMSALK